MAMEAMFNAFDWSRSFSESRDIPGDRYAYSKRKGSPLALSLDDKSLGLGPGLLNGQNVLSSLTELVLHRLTTRNFDELPVPFRAVAADIMSGEKVVFSSGSLAEAIRASLSIPGILQPYQIEGHYLVDGGIVDEIPVDVARSMGADIVIAIEAHGLGPRNPEELRSGFAVTTQALNLLVEQNRKTSRTASDILIRPDLSGFDYASYSDSAQLVQKGRIAGEEAMPALLSLAERVAKARALVEPSGQANRLAYSKPPLFAELRFEGGSKADQSLARVRMSPLMGRVPDRTEVRAAIDGLYSTGQFDFVRLDLLPLPPLADGKSRARVVLRLSPAAQSDSLALFGWNFRGLVSALGSNDSTIRTGILLHGLTGPGSGLFAEGAFVSKTDFELERGRGGLAGAQHGEIRRSGFRLRPGTHERHGRQLHPRLGGRRACGRHQAHDGILGGWCPSPVIGALGRRRSWGGPRFLQSWDRGRPRSPPCRSAHPRPHRFHGQRLHRLRSGQGEHAPGFLVRLAQDRNVLRP